MSPRACQVKVYLNTYNDNRKTSTYILQNEEWKLNATLQGQIATLIDTDWGSELSIKTYSLEKINERLSHALSQNLNLNVT